MSLTYKQIDFAAPIAAVNMDGETVDLVFCSEDKELDGGTKTISRQADEKFEVLPAPECERILIAAPSGAGKSYWAAKYAHRFNQLYPEKIVHIFCRQEDPAYADIDHEEIIMKDDILDRTIEVEELKDTLCIFDDMDSLQDKATFKAVHKLVNDILTIGRKHGVYCLYLGHVMLNGQVTKVINLECQKVVLYNGLGDRQNGQFLKTYCGMNKADIQYITEMDTRWVYVSRTRPRYIVYEEGVEIL